MKFFKTRYRIQRDLFAGYVVLYKPWWSPFWWQCAIGGFCGFNTHATYHEAEKYMEAHRQQILYDGY